MDDVAKEMAVRRRITSIFTKTRDAFDSKEDFDSYLETVEDIIYKLSFDIDVAEVEQQVADYQRQEAALLGTKAAADASTYVPVSMAAAVMQPMPTVQVELDKDGHIVTAKALLRGQQWQAMARASGWSEALITHKALQDAFASIFI